MMNRNRQESVRWSSDHHQQYQFVLERTLFQNDTKVRQVVCVNKHQHQIAVVEVDEVDEEEEDEVISEQAKTISKLDANASSNAQASLSSSSSAEEKAKKAVRCQNCLEEFYATWHIRLETLLLDEGGDGSHKCADLNEAILSKYDIKKCPSGSYLIQREGGCAQISCRNCQHVFCWWCLASLNNDFLLMHFSSGLCKSKLGHSRLSVFFNCAQTVSICIGISILIILASPVILLTLPCRLTSRCRQCCSRGGGGNHCRTNNNPKSNGRRGVATAV